MASEESRRRPLLSTLALVFAIYVISHEQGALARSSGSSLGNTGLLHSSSRDNTRFKGLDKVLNRLDGGGASTNNGFKTESPQLPSPSLDSIFKNSRSQSQDVTVTPPRSQFASDPKDKEFDNLDDDELDDDDSYEDEEDETIGNNDVLADKMSNWGYQYRNRYLASKTTTSTTTTTTTTTTPPPPPHMSYSQYKWQNYGSRQAVDESRRQSLQPNSNSNSNSGSGYPHYISNSNSHGSGSSYRHNGRHHGHNSHTGQHNQHHNHNYNSHHQQQHGNSNSNHRAQPQTPDTAIREAVNHALKVSKEGACKTPRPKVVRVQDYYPHPGKTYLPHCTILHQCSDDTGCCKHDLSCSPKTTQRVELSFYTITVDSNRGSTVERLVFYNHTECECRDKLDEMMPRDVSYSESPSTSKSFSLYNSLNPGSTSMSSGQSHNQNLLGNGSENGKSKNLLLRCKCPSTFTERILSDGTCSCDCFDKQMECLRQKRGRDFFSMQDKWCIQSGRCEIPGCTYGSYIHLAGRCPRKKEKMEKSLSWHRYLTE